MIDRVVYMINGWSIKGWTQVKQLEDELYEINEDYINDLDGFYIYDGMRGEYAFFGPILDRCDVKYEDSGYTVIDEKLLHDGDEKWNEFLEKYPKYAEVFKKYINNEPPQVMVVLHVW